MQRLAYLCLILGLLGCSQRHDETSQAVRRTRSAPATVKLAPGNSAIETSKVKPPPPLDPVEPPYVEKKRQSPGLQKEVDAYLNEPPIEIAAAKLVKDYQDEENAKLRYLERKVWVTGFVREKARGVLGAPYVKLDPGKAESGAVACFFEKGHGLDVEALKDGQEVTIEGRVSAKTGKDVRVDDCRLLTDDMKQSITAAVRKQQGK